MHFSDISHVMAWCSFSMSLVVLLQLTDFVTQVNCQECVFPFIYKSQSFTNCTTLDNNGVPWCATTRNFDSDLKWKICSTTKTAAISSNYFNSATSGIVDNRFTGGCLYSKGGEAGWIVVDLKQRYDIRKIAIAPVKDTSLDGYNIYIGDGPWRTCASYQIMSKFTFCATITPSLFVNQTTMNYTCTASGRYVAIVSPVSVGMYFYVCEVYAEGTLSANQDLPSNFLSAPYEKYCAINTTGENVAYKKKAYQYNVAYTYGPDILTDGLAVESTYTWSTAQHWHVVDLGQTYNVNYIRLWFPSSRGIVLNGYQIAVNENFRRCMPEKFLTWPACTTLQSYGGITMLETACIATGRFVVIRAPNVTDAGSALSEVEVYGTPATNVTILNYLAACSVTTDSSNLAYTGSAYSSSTAWSSLPTFVTDGTRSKTSYTRSNGLHWLVVDLQGESNVEYVRLWTRTDSSAALNGYQVSLGSYFRPCFAVNIISSYTVCNIISSTSGQEIIEFQCIGVGRYLAISAPSLQTTALVLTEVEAFGSRPSKDLTNSNDVTSRCSVTTTEENLAYQKRSYQSSVTWSRTFGTDGSLSSIIGTDKEYYPWIAVDLQKVYSVKFVRLWNNADVNTSPYVDILVSTSFRPCETYILDNFQLCKRVNIDKSSLITEANCTTALQGQFILVKYGSPNDTLAPTVALGFNEIEVFGDALAMKPQKAPSIDLSDPNLPLNVVSPAKAAILQGVRSKIGVGYGACRVNYADPNSETIIGDPDSGEAIMVATQYKQGRMISMGNHELLATIKTNSAYAKLWTNMQNWLKGGLTTTPTKRLSVVQNYTNGDIVILQGYVRGVTLDQMNTLHTKLSQGLVAVLHALSAWQIQFTALENINQYFLCNATKVYISDYILTYGSNTLSLATTPVDYSHLSIQRGLQMSRTTPWILGSITKQLISLRSMKAYHVNSFNFGSLPYEIVTTYQDFVKYQQPCTAWPLNDTSVQRFLYGYNLLIISQLITDVNYKAPGVFNFPGDFASPPPTIASRRLRITSTYKTEYHSTGLYLPPGTTLYYNIEALTRADGQTASPSDWNIRIGCNTDDNVKKDAYFRFPVVALAVSLEYNKVFSPFGGIIWLESNRVNSSITITFYNVVETPYFNIRDGVNVDKYNVRRNAPGLWADIAGDAMILCLPSSYIRSYSVDYVKTLMSNTWDQVVKLDYEFQGKNWRVNTRHRASIDVQISLGYGHSGYPIMGYMDWFYSMWNKTLIEQGGAWGMCHEIGHNMQRGVWTFSGTGEVTNNVFCLFNYETVWNISIIGSNYSALFSNDQVATMKTYLNKGAPFSQWTSSPFLALATYYEIALCYGWGTFKNAFIYYLQNDVDVSDDQDKIDTWLYVMSFTTKKNLKPIFDYWGFTISTSMAANVSQWQCSLPDDVFTQYNVARADAIRTQYGNACTTSCSTVPFYLTESITPMLSNDVEELL